jgi:hypothetical protein
VSTPLAFDPAGLPPISVRVRQWIYGFLFLLVLAANGMDIFFDPSDLGIPIAKPWWLPGVLRVLALLSGTGNLLALANTRPSISEAVKAEAKATGQSQAEVAAQWGGAGWTEPGTVTLPAGAQLVVPVTEPDPDEGMPGDDDDDGGREPTRFHRAPIVPD